MGEVWSEESVMLGMVEWVGESVGKSFLWLIVGGCLVDADTYK